jgi:hypothetical protein
VTTCIFNISKYLVGNTICSSIRCALRRGARNNSLTMTITQLLPRPARRRTPKIESPQTGRKLSFIVPAPDYNATPEELYNAIRTETVTLNADWELLFIDHGRCENNLASDSQPSPLRPHSCSRLYLFREPKSLFSARVGISGSERRSRLFTGSGSTGRFSRALPLS